MRTTIAGKRYFKFALMAGRRVGALSVLFLLFRLGSDCYALDTSRVVEILPLVDIRTMPRSPSKIVGTINYRGAFVPVLDFSDLAFGARATPRLSTRIVLIRFDEQAQHLLGLIVENATETLRLEPGAFVSPGIVNNSAKYLGPIAMGPHGMVQRLELDQLLPASLQGWQVENRPQIR
jgi:chemotaxis-related protein WspB